ncbi:hypothetical protein EDD15DRAFT_2193450 [Pisolithus albus]|nr:hypothetical protein EDD15DRAFT_2193450 [Pisolithus albus]
MYAKVIRPMPVPSVAALGTRIFIHKIRHWSRPSRNSVAVEERNTGKVKALPSVHIIVTTRNVTAVLKTLLKELDSSSAVSDPQQRAHHSASAATAFPTIPSASSIRASRWGLSVYVDGNKYLSPRSPKGLRRTPSGELLGASRVAGNILTGIFRLARLLGLLFRCLHLCKRLHFSTPKTGSMCIATNAVSDDDERGPVKQRFLGVMRSAVNESTDPNVVVPTSVSCGGSSKRQKRSDTERERKAKKPSSTK